MKQKTKKKVKKKVQQLFFIWRVITITTLSIILIPLFIKNAWSGHFYFWTLVPSIIVYVCLTYIQLKLLKGKVTRYIEVTATRLFLGICSLTAAFISLMIGYPLWGNTFLVVGAVLYALFLHRIGFLRWFII